MASSGDMGAIAEGLREREHISFPIVFNLHLNRLLDLNSIDVGEKGYSANALHAYYFRLRMLGALILARTYNPEKRKEINERMIKLEETLKPSVINKIGPQQVSVQWDALTKYIETFDYLMSSANGTGYIPPLGITSRAFSVDNEYGEDYVPKPGDLDYKKKSVGDNEADGSEVVDSAADKVQSAP